MKNGPGSQGKPAGVPCPASRVGEQSIWPDRRGWLWGIGLFLAVVLVYQPVWRAGYIWDDDALITENPCVVGPFGLRQVWTTRAADICPLTITTFWAEHKLWGLAPLPYHLVNVLLHAAGAVLLWRVLRRLRMPGAWLGAALWALHPVLVGSVAWISEMKNTLSGLFYLLAALCYLRSWRDPETAGEKGIPWPGGWTVLFAALAMVGKSSTVVLPAVLGLLAVWMDGRWRWRRWLALWPVFLLSLATVVYSVRTQLHRTAAYTVAHPARGWLERLASAGDALWFYLGKLLWPHPLMMVYPRWEIDPRTAFVFLPTLAVVVALALLWWKRRSWGAGPWLTAAYFVVALSPVLGLVEIDYFRYAFVADHFVYLASMGPLALAGAGLARLANRFLAGMEGWRVGLGAGLLLACGAASWQHARVYESSESLWNDLLAKHPNYWVAYGNLGVALAKEGRFDDAIGRYREALRYGPAADAQTHVNLGDVYLRRGQLDQAAGEYREAARLDPDDAENYYDLGNVFLQQGRLDDAISQFQAAVQHNEGYLSARSNLGAAYNLKGQTEEAITQYEKAVGIDPRNVQNLNSLGNLYLQKGQLDKATAQYQAALLANPDDAYTYRNVGNMFAQRGRLDEAIAQYRSALQINPADAETHNNLGNALLQKGLLDDALAQYREAVRRDPGYAAGHRNLGLALARKGQLDPAVAELREAIRLKPDYREAMHDLSVVQAAARQAAGGQ